MHPLVRFVCLLLWLIGSGVLECCCISRMMAPSFLVRFRRLDQLRLDGLLVLLVVYRTNGKVDCLEV